MFIDSHCHLDFPQYNDDRAMVIGNAKKAGVKKFVNPGVDLESSARVAFLAKEHPGVVFPCVGFHPYEAQGNPDVQALEKLISKQAVAIGECGLDYHMYKGEAALGKKTNQKRLFAEQLELALKHRLPVIFHCRDAYEDFFSVLDAASSLPKGVIHCFSGGLQELRMAQERGFLVGIDGNVTYSKQLSFIVPAIPLDILLLETDAPYLTPEPHRGTRNEPKYIPLVAKKVAELLTVSVEEVEDKTSNNASTLFQIAEHLRSVVL